MSGTAVPVTEGVTGVVGGVTMGNVSIGVGMGVSTWIFGSTAGEQDRDDQEYSGKDDEWSHGMVMYPGF